MEKQLLREFKLFEANDIKPADSSDGIMRMSGVIQRAGAPNANRRIYPRPVLEREDGRFQDLVNSRTSLGECDHPDSPVVQLENVSHLITKTWWDGNDLLGEIEVLDTPKGKIIESLVKRDVTLGISSRGMGTTSPTNEGYDMVEDDFNLVTYDLVSNPSTNGAFMHLKENKEWKKFAAQDKWLKLESILDEILRIK